MNYGKESRKTIRIILAHYKFDLVKMRKMERRELIKTIFSAAKLIKEWLWANFINKRLIELVHRVYSEVKA